MSTVYAYAAPFLPSPVEQTGLSNSPHKKRPKKLENKHTHTHTKKFTTVFIFNLEQKKGENSQLTSSVRGNKSSSIHENSGEQLAARGQQILLGAIPFIRILQEGKIVTLFSPSIYW